MLVLTITLGTTGAAFKDSGGAEVAASPGSAGAQTLPRRVTPPERCPDARQAVAFYRRVTWDRQKEREARELADRTPVARGKTCRWVKYAAREHQARAKAALDSLRRWKARMKTPAGAICHVFGPYCSQALSVARCESGHAMTPRAVNGQYLGMFQMGNYARSRYGHGPDPLTQARAAYRYFIDSGRDWSPWQCRPVGGLAW